MAPGFLLFRLQVAGFMLNDFLFSIIQDGTPETNNPEPATRNLPPVTRISYPANNPSLNLHMPRSYANLSACLDAD